MMQPLTGRDPTTLGTYTLTGRLGTGGFGVVYAAQDAEGAPVAIKLLDSGLSSDQSFRDRLVREGSAMRLVESDRTVRVVEVVSEGDDAYLVMELIDGTPLDTYVDTNGPFRGLELWLIASGLVEALNAIHSAGIIHRDLKPANVMYGADGVKVLDFGISAVVGDSPHTRTGTFLASANWTSPEQFRDEPVTTASDVFMLGLVLAYVATGQHPFGTGRSDAIMFRIAHESPDLELVPPPLHEVVTACLAKNPAERPSPVALQHFFSAGGNEALQVGGDLGPQGTLVVGGAAFESTTALEQTTAVEPAADTPQVDGSTSDTLDVDIEAGSEPATEGNKTTVVSTPPQPAGISEHTSKEPTRRQPKTLISAVIALVAILGISGVMFAALGGEKPVPVAEPATTNSSLPETTASPATSKPPETTAVPVTTDTPETTSTPATTEGGVTTTTNSTNSSGTNGDSSSSATRPSTLPSTPPPADSGSEIMRFSSSWDWETDDRLSIEMELSEPDIVVWNSVSLSSGISACSVPNPPGDLNRTIYILFDCPPPDSAGEQLIVLEYSDEAGNEYRETWTIDIPSRPEVEVDQFDPPINPSNVSAQRSGDRIIYTFNPGYVGPSIYRLEAMYCQRLPEEQKDVIGVTPCDYALGAGWTHVWEAVCSRDVSHAQALSMDGWAERQAILAVSPLNCPFPSGISGEFVALLTYNYHWDSGTMGPQYNGMERLTLQGAVVADESGPEMTIFRYPQPFVVGVEGRFVALANDPSRVVSGRMEITEDATGSVVCSDAYVPMSPEPSISLDKYCTVTSAPGQYTITATAVDDLGHESTISQSITLVAQ